MPLYDADEDYNVAYVKPVEGYTYYGDPAPTERMMFVDENNYAEIMVDLQYSYDFTPVYLIMEGTWDSDAGRFKEDGAFTLMFNTYDDTCVEISLPRDVVEN